MKLFTTLAWLFLGLVAVQFFLAGIGIFGAGSFDAHVINGTLLLVVALALSIVAALHPLTALVLVVLGYALARGSTLAELARPAR